MLANGTWRHYALGQNSRDYDALMPDGQKVGEFAADYLGHKDLLPEHRTPSCARSRRLRLPTALDAAALVARPECPPAALGAQSLW